MILTSAHEPGVKVLNCVHEFSKTGGPQPSTQVPARACGGRGGAGHTQALPPSLLPPLLPTLQESLTAQISPLSHLAHGSSVHSRGEEHHSLVPSISLSW